MDPLSFALDAVSRVQKMVTELLASEPKPDVRAANKRKPGHLTFVFQLNPLLAEVQAHLNRKRIIARTAPDNNARGRILRLLEALEVLVNWPNRPGFKPNPNDPFSSESYGTLRNGLTTPDQRTTAMENIQNLSSRTDHIAHAERLKFQGTLNNFSRQRRAPQGIRLAELVVSTEKLARPDEYPECVRLLHSALHHSLHVKDRDESYTANIGLMRVQRCGAANDEVLFDCFFRHRHSGLVGNTDTWKRAQIRVFFQNDQTRLPSVRWQGGMVDLVSPDDICGLICGQNHVRHVFSAHRDGLSWQSTQPLEMLEGTEQQFLRSEPSVSLDDVLRQGHLHRDIMLKLLLSYLLAKATWKFYESDWMTPHWTKHVIHFMRQKLDFLSNSHETYMSIHMPHLRTEIRSSLHFRSPSEEPPRDPSFMEKYPQDKHPHPKVRALGILLLEIELGKGMETFYQESTRMPDDDAIAAKRIIESTSWNKGRTYLAVQEMIQMCIKGGTGDFGFDESSARDNVSTYIVEPLRRLFKLAWSTDQEPDSFHTGPVSIRSEELSPGTLEAVDLRGTASTTAPRIQSLPLRQPRSPSIDHNPHSKSSPCSDQARPIPGIELSSDEDGEPLAGELHDGEGSVELRTNKWFKRFQKSLFTHDLLGRDQLFKVAILDSGIDTSYFSSDDLTRIKEKRSFISDDDLGGMTEKDSFISDDAWKDTSSDHHGTHVAAVILRLTKNVQLCIGKVTNESKFNQREEIARAIKVAREEWGVHMISLSFGFPQHQHPDQIKHEVDECLKANVIVFASASNEGSLGPRTYPAEYERVLCVYSATSQGVKSDFNPLTGIRDIQYKFMFVGEHIRPVWGLPTTRSQSPMRYQSGTSYATPVAVAVAAFVLGYIAKNFPKTSWRTEPRSPEGIERIFKVIAVQTGGDYYFVNPVECFDLGDKERLIRESLRFYLGGK